MKIFLAEDSEIILERLRCLVGRLRGAVLAGEARGQDAALAGIEATAPDAVVLDLRLAQGSGIGVLRHARCRWPQLRIIVLTSNGAPAYREACLRLGADAFLDKARDIDALAQYLESAAST